MIEFNDETLTTEQYLNKQHQSEIDKLFEEALKEAQNTELEELQSREHEDYVIKLISKLADIEAELSIVEDELRESYNKENVSTETITRYKNDIRNFKSKYTRTKHELDNIILQERKLENNG